MTGRVLIEMLAGRHLLQEEIARIDDFFDQMGLAPERLRPPQGEPCEDCPIYFVGPMLEDPVKCERDWQGPSDDKTEDDLLVVNCVRRILQPPHLHDMHIGIVEDTPGESTCHVVYWFTGTGDLWNLDGTLFRRQSPVG